MSPRKIPHLTCNIDPWYISAYDLIGQVVIPLDEAAITPLRQPFAKASAYRLFGMQLENAVTW